MATWNPTPIATGTATGWTRESDGTATNLYLEVDEGIAAADDTGIKVAIGGAAANFTLSDPPADFDPLTVSKVEFQIRHKQAGRSDDTIPGTISQAMLISGPAGRGTPVLAANTNSASDPMVVNPSSPYSTSYTDTAVIQAAYVKADGTVSDWSGASVAIRPPNASTTKGADAITWYIDTFDITVTYTPITASPLTLSHLGIVSSARRKVA